ncbi:ceramide glucosyltransferase [Colletotrichum karsti]|uniref:Ceramide glucosyltransferase n=1 Tax=Colletotrichum karsti TaxID=1095194 RepID=A0A9P6I511_9PEZI|nr:ceramide glucosyltransferase [Colletotrichum karsti]KAF9877062.1 ceramide glucosyltransferase [Colletotrichum karsti]
MADFPPLVQTIALVCAIWSTFIYIVQSIGIFRIFFSYSYRPKPATSSSLKKDDVPHITIIRPVKGLEHGLYECIASTFQQDYPTDKMTIYLCVAEKSDPAYPVLKQLVQDFPAFDARVLVEEEDPLLHGQRGHVDNLGPNPKIRNISRAYREAKGDIIWVMDCNVWISKGVAGRMVDKLLGYGPGGKQVKPYKFVHMLPVVVDTVSPSDSPSRETQTLLASGPDPDSSQGHSGSLMDYVRTQGGGRLDEMFMASSHAKFYGAINTVGVAPCAVGKSTMFRKSHLDQITDPAQNPIISAEKKLPKGIDHFSEYICEDHLIGDLLWRSKLPGFRNHGLVVGDLAVQPMAGMSVRAYFNRRARWLRARKYTVLAATLIEPGVESLLCCGYFAFAVTTLPWFNKTFDIAQTWSAFGLYWFGFVFIWMICDWFTFNRLHAGHTIEIDENTPKFARGTAIPGGMPRRSFLEWLAAWLGREFLALPIWTWAVFFGSTVTWRVGWVCALPKEQTAAIAMLDHRHPDIPNMKPVNDTNAYTLGSIGKHNIVIACLPKGQVGTVSAANVASRMISTFPSIKFGLMVGIGGGIPSKVRLGDVVVSTPTGQHPGVVQWDMGKATEGGRFQRTGALNNPPTLLLTALTRVETEQELTGSKIPEYLDELKQKWPKLAANYLRSDRLRDVVFKAESGHVDSDGQANSDDEDELENCWLCDKTKAKERKTRETRIHYGLIASGNQVVKDGLLRERLNKDLGGNLLCVEMEAAGLMTNFPCLVIRGICDYADAHKNKDWQEHAAAVAAAFVKEFLDYVPPEAVEEEPSVLDTLRDSK